MINISIKSGINRTCAESTPEGGADLNIGEVGKKTGLSSKTIRYYERRGLIRVDRQENGYRTYDDETAAQLRRIRLLREAGVSVAEIRLFLDGVITKEELLKKRLCALVGDSKRSVRSREICEALLAGDRAGGAGDELRFAQEIFREEEAPEDGAEEVPPDCPLFLGIDIGTTSLSAQLVASEDGRCIETYSFDHHAALELSGFPDAFADDAAQLISRAQALIGSVTRTYGSVASIGVTGQMHGIVCLDADGEILSPFFTWQNEFGLRRMNPDLPQLVCEAIEERCGEQIPTGYGLATFFALRHFGMLPAGTEKIVTIMDLLVSRLTGKPPVMHPTDAASFGAFDLRTNRFRVDVLRALDIPQTYLPAVVDGYAVAGMYRTTDGREIPVSVAIGDNQAGVFGSLKRDGMVLVNVGTSGQISAVCGASDAPEKCAGQCAGPLKTDLYRPYFDGSLLFSGATLCGGRAYALLADFVEEILRAFGADAGRRRVYDYLNRAAARCEAPLSVATQFCGTRADPSVRGEIRGIGLHNFTPEALSAGFLKGIVDELYRLYRAWARGGKSEPVCPVVSGNAMRRNPALRKFCGEIFGKRPLMPRHTEEAAFGAALYGAVSARCITRAQSRALIAYETEDAEDSERKAEAEPR